MADSCPFMAISAAMEGSKDQSISKFDKKMPLKCPISGRGIDNPRPEHDHDHSFKQKKAGMSTISERAEDFTADSQDQTDMRVISSGSSSGSLRSQTAPSHNGSQVGSQIGSHIGSHIGSLASGIRSNLPTGSRLLPSASCPIDRRPRCLLRRS